ncbi:hypothetical protein T05_13397 [Trichinella murrelli]|uniref:Uncharacterized protein n=1 Tax=Trichinella murrelli TaxID=144512 RepID=A0A0V0SUU8_9BILA|nr:hypothetical protein T05_13397 [Trichinella murrelli]
MYGSHFWTRVVSSNDLPIVSADSSHVFSDQLTLTNSLLTESDRLSLTDRV